MQKQEYLFVSVRYSDGISLQNILVINGITEKVTNVPSKQDIAERFGKEGWVLVAESHELNWEMTFTRPKPITFLKLVPHPRR